MRINQRYVLQYFSPTPDIPPEVEECYNELGLMGVCVDKSMLPVPGKHSHFDAFDVVRDGIHDDTIDKIEARIRALGYVKLGPATYSVTFSDKERDEAAYLGIRSVYAGIEAKNKYTVSIHRSDIKTVAFGKEMYLNEHLIQVEQPHISKMPQWRVNRQFCSDYASAMIHLFCSDMAKRIIERNSLTGAEFRHVYDNKTEDPVENLWQLWPHESADFFVPNDRIPVRKCPVCGANRYITTDVRYRLKVSKDRIPKGVDFFQSPSLVGAEIGFPKYIVTNHAYLTLKKENITRSLVFEPIELC